MALKNAVDEALKKPMSRKDFLAHAGAALLAVIGVTTMLHSLGLHEAAQPQTARVNNPAAGGGGTYGSSVYGG
jgi:hypothetical protein